MDPINPYAAPQSSPGARPPPLPKQSFFVCDALRLAEAQRAMARFGAMKFCIEITAGGVLARESMPWVLVYLLLYFVATPATALGTIRTAALVHGGLWPAIVWGLVSFIPCVGLLGVALLNGNAVDLLRHMGVHSRYFGASAAELDRLKQIDPEN